MQHEHVARFYGMCQELETPCILMVRAKTNTLRTVRDNNAKIALNNNEQHSTQRPNGIW